MEDILMEKLVIIDEHESAFIAGGRSEEMAHFVETIAICIGVCSRLIYHRVFYIRNRKKSRREVTLP